MKVFFAFSAEILRRKLFLFISTVYLSSNMVFGQELPMKKERTVSYSISKGTNMDLDISPDGRILLFTVAGEVFKVPAKGGKAEQLTRGLALNSRPVWSPDGSLIAYTSDKTGRPAIHLMDVKGRPLDFATRSEISSLSQEIYWRGDSVLTFPIRQPYKYNVRGVNLRVTSNDKYLVYLSGSAKEHFMDSLIVLDLEAKKKTLLAFLGLKNGGYLETQRYCFSPDQSSLYIAYHGKIHKIGLKDGKNEVVPFTVDLKVDMAELNSNKYKLSLDSSRARYIRNIQLNPSKTQILFAALNKVFVKDLPNGPSRLLCEQPFGQFQPSYSPDGKWVVYVTWQDSLKGHLWRVKSNGGLPEQLTSVAANYQHPCWSKDGNNIAFAKLDKLENGRRAVSKLQVINVRSMVISEIDSSIPMFNRFTFLKDTLISYSKKQEGDFHRLVARSLDGKYERTLSEKFPMNSMGDHLADIQISAENGCIIYSHGESLYLVPEDKTKLLKPVASDIEANCKIIRFSTMGVDPHWEDEGRTVAWNYGNRYYRLATEKILISAESTVPSKEKGFIDVLINPDQTIEITLDNSARYGEVPILLTNVRIITMGKAGVIKNGTILIRNGRFELVTRGREKALAKGNKVVNLNGRTVMPGLIDLHDHVFAYPFIFPTQHWAYQAALAYGTTTSRNPAASYEMFGHQELLNSGIWTGPRLYHVGSAVKDWYGITSQQDADNIARSRSVMGGIAIKQYYQPTRMKRQLLATAAAKYKLNLTNEDADFLEVVGMLKDGSAGVEHIKYWQDNYQDVVALMAKSGTVWTPTLLATPMSGTMKTYFANKYPLLADQGTIGADLLRKYSKMVDLAGGFESQIKKYPAYVDKFLDGIKVFPAIVNAGGLIGVGGHGEIPGLGMHYEMWALKMSGMTNLQVLECATLTGAKALGLERDLGSIEKGKIADLLILDGNPLDDIHQTNTIRYIMKAGILYDQKTLKEVDLEQLSKESK